MRQSHNSKASSKTSFTEVLLPDSPELLGVRTGPVVGVVHPHPQGAGWR